MNASTVSAAPLARQLGDWAASLTFADLPSDVVDATRLRILDVIGLAFAGADTPFGRSTTAGLMAVSPPGPSRLFTRDVGLAVATAAYVNAALPQALEFDDTHNESIVHMSSPAVAATLALADARPVSGRELLTAIALGNEVSCRIGSVSPGQFHRLGFHPTGLFAPFGVTYASGRLLGLDPAQLAHAAGICGSSAAGLLECWVDGTDTKFLHSGMAAQNGILAATLAGAGTSGPPGVLEGRFGLFASHLHSPDVPRDYGRITTALGTEWESRRSSFKPYPAAHVLHPYLDALFELLKEEPIEPAAVERIDCPVAAFIVGIVCEPVAEKVAPATGSHCRVSLQYTMAEALVRGRLGKDAYGDASRLDPEVLALARRVFYTVDPDYPGPGRFKGAVEIRLKDGRVRSRTQEFNRGAPENPMSVDELRGKFEDNIGSALPAATRRRLAETILRTEELADARDILSVTRVS